MATEESDVSAEIVTKAKHMGWSPKEDWRGDPEKWVDASTYVERGEQILPIVNANNRRLQEENAQLKTQVSTLAETLKANAEAIEELKAFNSEMARDKAKEKAVELRTALRAARENNDVEAELQLEEQLEDNREALRKAEETKSKAKVTEPPEAQDFTKSPDWKAWATENPWFGSDRRKSAMAMGIADELRANPETAGLRGREFLDKISEEVDKVFGGNQRRQTPGKVEGSRGSGDGGGSGGKHSFADLPADAQAACDRQATKLVGEGRAFKTKSEWRNHYVSNYDWS